MSAKQRVPACKYIARHKIEVGAAIIVIIAVIIGLTGTTISMIRATKAEAIALEEAANTDRHVSDFMIGLFEVSDPNATKGDTITAREILDKGAERVNTELSDQPLIQTRLMSTIGLVYYNLSLFEQAEKVLEEALAIKKEEFGEEGLKWLKGSMNWQLFLYTWISTKNWFLYAGRLLIL